MNLRMPAIAGCETGLLSTAGSWGERDLRACGRDAAHDTTTNSSQFVTHMPSFGERKHNDQAPKDVLTVLQRIRIMSHTTTNKKGQRP
jgi:hypothetical protein